MSAPDKNISIAICGGGIGGLSLAIGLLRYPHLSVHIYESASAFGEIGAGVSFGPNAVRAMKLINPSILRGYNRRRTENEFMEKKDVWFDFRWGMDTRNGKAGEWFHSTIANGTGQSSIHRVSLKCFFPGGGGLALELNWRIHFVICKSLIFHPFFFSL
jgi:salicylate hydroxylase